MDNTTKFWNDMLSAQKTMMDTWQKTVNPAATTSDAANPFATFMEMSNFMQTQQNMMNAWAKMMNPSQDFPNYEPLKAWQKAMEAYNPLEAAKFMPKDSMEVFEKMMNSNQFYTAMAKFWEDLNESYVKTSSKEYDKIVSDLTARYESSMKDFLLPLIPAEMRTFVESPYNMAKNAVETMQNFFAPWKESYAQLSTLFIQGIYQDPKKLNDYLKLWKENYDRTIGELLTSPVVGSHRELIEQQNKAMDMMIDMMVDMSEYTASIMAVASNNTKTSIENYMEMVEKGDHPKTYQEFYKYMSESVEKAVEKYFYTDEFANIISKATDSYMKFKIETDKLIEKYFANTPIVTMEKVNSVYKSVYDLKKEIKALKKQVEHLEKQPELFTEAQKKKSSSS